VRDREHAQVRERHGAALLPDSGAPQLRTNGSGQGADRRMERRERQCEERDERETDHCAVQSYKRTARVSQAGRLGLKRIAGVGVEEMEARRIDAQGRHERTGTNWKRRPSEANGPASTLS
jgi:hypothetical protein